MAKDEFLIAFAPIQIVTAGGFLAVSYLHNRETTGDLDYVLDPEWDKDDDIKIPLQYAIHRVADKLQYDYNWMNDSMNLFMTDNSKKKIFRGAKEQNIVLFRGRNLLVRAAPMEWVLERKLRRIYLAERHRKAEFDMSDALAILKYMRDEKKTPLDRARIRKLNMNGFDPLPDNATMDRVATAYRKQYNEEIFS